MGDLTEHFSSREFQCHCGCGLCAPDPSLLYRLEEVRQMYGKPINISSGTRCKIHNAAVGGNSRSGHLVKADGYSKAADIEVFDGTEMYELLTLLIRYFPRIGLDGRGDKRFIHVDIGGFTPLDPWIWTY